MKLYTGRGDAGETDLFGGQRVSKDALRVEAYGSVDELNAALGLCLAACGSPNVQQMLLAIQSRLFEIGADLASPRREDNSENRAVPRLDQEQVREMEGWIDQVVEPLEPMKSFILPGGTELSARLHLARVVCRRAERRCVTLQAQEPVGPALLVYLNRLSDLLFALARLANHEAGVADVPWMGPRAGA